MLTTLFHIPSQIRWGDATLPVFGFGLLLAVVVVVGLIAVGVTAARHGWRAAISLLGGPLFLAVGMVAFVLPALDDGQGVPIRGYGVMLLAAAAAGIHLSIVRGRAMGFDADTILSLGMEMFVAGIVGARLFYVLQYHEQFFRPDQSLLASILAVLNIPAGGLVVFGSLPTAAAAGIWFARRRGLPVLKLADCIAPGMLVGLAIGRIGCFLNGCCYGGPCDLPWAVQFPPGSPPWADQVQRGMLPMHAAGEEVAWSLPVHPAQLYAAIDAGLLAALAIAFTPVARRQGEVFALVLTLHPISRILLEAIRIDEPPAFGTPLSISQLMSLVLLGLALPLWWWIARRGGLCSAERGR